MTIAIKASGDAQPLYQHEEEHKMNEHQIVDFKLHSHYQRSD